MCPREPRPTHWPSRPPWEVGPVFTPSAQTQGAEVTCPRSLSHEVAGLGPRQPASQALHRTAVSG